jgi:hypothetical protein
MSIAFLEVRYVHPAHGDLCVGLVAMGKLDVDLAAIL